MNTLKKSFFMKDTIEVARGLLGCYLVRRMSNGRLIKGKIVETEAYLGVEDSCCHSFKGRYTERTKSMYLEGGYAYIYFTYGMYHCLNIITSKKNVPEAVLIRALEPIEGLKEMQKHRNQTDITNLCSGPGKLCQALDITRNLNEKPLFETTHLYLEQKKSPEKEIETDMRIGLSPKKDSCYWPLRFFLKQNNHVSINKSLLE